MFKTKNSKGTEAFWLLSFALLALFFIGIAIVDGPEWCKDSPSYDSMDFTREPIYPLFLMGLRTLCGLLGVEAQPYGLPAYLTAAVLLQSLLWVVVTLYLGHFIYDISSKALSEKRSRLLAVIAMLSQVGVASLNRFVANRGSMYSESIMTESLAMPLFVLFTVTLIKSFDNYNIYAVLMLMLQAILMASIRKQMLIMLIMWAGASFIMHLFIRGHRALWRFIMTMVAVVLCFLAITFFDKLYNEAVRGVFAPHVGNSRGALCTVLYTAEADDAVLFEEASSEEFPELAALYTRIYEECTSRGLTIDYAPGYELKEKSNFFNSDWVSMVDHYAQSYDVIGFEIVLPFCDEYVAETYPELEGAQAQVMEDKVEAALLKVLLKHHADNILHGIDRGAWYVLSSNIIKAFVISNANISPRFLTKVSAVIYLIFVLVMVLVLVRALSLKAKDGSEESRKKSLLMFKVLLMGFIVIMGLAINCVVTGSMIFPQPRYMCYSMGLFYLTLCCGILSQ